MGAFDWATTAREKAQGALGAGRRKASDVAHEGLGQVSSTVLGGPEQWFPAVARKAAPSMGTMRELPPEQTGVYPSLQAAQAAAPETDLARQLVAYNRPADRKMLPERKLGGGAR